MAFFVFNLHGIDFQHLYDSDSAKKKIQNRCYVFYNDKSVMDNDLASSKLYEITLLTHFHSCQITRLPPSFVLDQMYVGYVFTECSTPKMKSIEAD